jgi:hypothetical protein
MFLQFVYLSYNAWQYRVIFVYYLYELLRDKFLQIIQGMINIIFIAMIKC